jgi:threonine dehydrogenase-like Zn-dependent dehydrogenase
MTRAGRFAYLAEPMRIELREHALPDVGPGGLLVRVRRANVCGSDLHIWRGRHPQLKRGVLGHEMLGEVAELGQGVTRDFAGTPLAPGDRVVATYFLCCRRCPPCARGDFNLCLNAYRYFAAPPEEHPHFHGAFATHYYVHPDQYVYRVPDEVPDRIAAGVNCALSQVIYALDRGRVVTGQTLLVQGAGGLGLYATAVARERGVRTIVLESVPARLELARLFGADVVIDLAEHDSLESRVAAVHDVTGGEGADVALEVTGVPAAFSEGPFLLRPGGRYVVVGNISPGQTAPFDPGSLVRRQVEILPVIRYQPWYLALALEFLRATRERYPYDELCEDGYGLDDVERAMRESSERMVTRATIVCAR